MQALQLGETVADAVAERLAVDGFAGESFSGRFDDGTHLFKGGSAQIGYGFFDGSIHFCLGSAGGEIGFEDLEFAGLLIDEILPAAFGELLDRFLALFDESLEQLNRFRLIEGTNLFDFFQLKRGFHHAEDAEAQFVLGFHGGNDVFLNLFGKRHRWLPFGNYSSGTGRLTG